MGDRRKYDRDFKEGAVRLVIDGGKSARSVARDLGIHENMLHRWKAEYLEDCEHAFPGKGHLKPHEEELLKMKRRVTDLEEEREILKKALAIFSKHRR
jgi:transposase